MDQKLMDSVLACPNLPSLPTVAMDVLELTRDKDVKFKEIAKAVQNDQGLSTKILRTVNSSYYGLSKPCPTIERALAYLGLNTVKSLVLGFSLVDIGAASEDDLDLVPYWQRGLYSSNAARQVALQHKRCDPDEVLIAALMQDIGMLAMHAALKKKYVDCVTDCDEAGHAGLPDAESEAFSFNHIDIGAALAEKWRLPTPFVEAIRNHHATDYEGGEERDFVLTVVLGYMASQVIASDNPAPAIAMFREKSKEWFRFSESDADDCLAKARDDAKELGRLFQIDSGDMPDVNSLLSEAEEATFAHQLNVQREAESLKQTNDKLVKQVGTDGLTGIANRSRFDEVIKERMDQARSFKGCVGLILCDLDKFKGVNDTHGHQVGDAVLVEAARRMAANIRDVDIVCRYGGEEFAVVLPGATRKESAIIAERLRRVLEAEPVDLSLVPDAVDELSVSASFGLAVLDPDTINLFTEPKTMIVAADKALYAAKEGGRNCVRVHTARPKAA